MSQIRVEESTYDENQAAGPGLGSEKDTMRFGYIALALVLVGLIPRSIFTIRGVHALGPLDFTAIISMAGVLFAVITALRAREGQWPQALKLGVIAFLIGIFRIFAYPIFGI